MNGHFDKVMLNFSGGYDSLAAADILADKTPTVHLVTFKLLTESGTALAKTNLDKLRREHPGTGFIHRIVDIRDLQKKILSVYPEKVMEYRGRWAPLGMWCCTCQLSMRAASIIYCLENGITWCADGATRAEYHHSSHKVEFINAVKKLYGEYGIRFFNPVYDFEGNTRDFLAGKGYKVGKEVFAVKNVQPFCVCTFFSNLRQMTGRKATPDGVVAEYVRSMIPVIRDAVNGSLREKGIDIAGLNRIEPDGGELLRHDREHEHELEISGTNWGILALKFLMSPVYFLFDLSVYLAYLRKKRSAK